MPPEGSEVGGRGGTGAVGSGDDELEVPVGGIDRFKLSQEKQLIFLSLETSV